ncbi:MAG: sporulation protein YunB [Oscillospiraceae bacterium]|nr:sporulation protein YunB [Oscillospiraceae bacterium]
MGMTFAGRDRLRSVLAVVLTVLTVLTLLVRMRLAPMAQRLVETQVSNQASDAINEAIAEQIAAGRLEYENIVTVEKDQTGAVTAIRTNMERINLLKTGILKCIDEKLSNLSVEEMRVPLGSVLLPELLSGRGPGMPVRVLAVRTSDAAFRNDFSAAGINQTRHSIYIDIQVTVTVLTWSGTFDVTADASVAAAETVIVGTVPTTYFGMEELP